MNSGSWYFNFELILFYATLVTGIIALIDIIWFAPARKKAAKAGHPTKVPTIIDYARSFFPVLLIVFLLRSFLAEPFRIPSGSLEPTLLTGDFILVNKFDYGVRLPVLHKRIWGKGKPNRGDIMVFRWPPDPSYNFIKRVIGIPGDKISYIDKELLVNGEKIPQTYLQKSIAYGENNNSFEAIEKREDLLGIKHNIFINPDKPSHNFYDIEVPDGMYFVMGDNRDDSADSRYWGFVPDENIVGKAMVVLLSWNSVKTNIRWHRFGTVIH